MILFFDTVEQVNGNGWSNVTDKGKMAAACFAGNLKLIRYKGTLTSSLSILHLD